MVKDCPAVRFAELPLAVSPRFVELCFQTASLSGLALQSRLGLPHAFRELKFASLPDSAADKAYYAAVASNPDGSYDVKMVDSQGNFHMTLLGYQTMNLPDPIQKDLVEPMQRAFGIGMAK